jgi:uncharacterized protein YyaL (SSP411 family)
MRQTRNERLAGETSPYILQHADNPVDWYPWGPAAFEHAKAEDKPVFLSVGYASCHWCHVMAHESFEDPKTAALMNERFISIKVDREERPDVDAVYMDAVQTMTGGGGWPMSIFLTPDREPFYAGTYFPDTPRHGMPSFRQVLEGIADAWDTRRADVLDQGAQVSEAIERTIPATPPGALDESGARKLAGRAVATLARTFDERWGGFGGAPKFPQASVLRWLLDRAARGDRDAGIMLVRTLEKMADGGIHDQVGGGFARYSTDATWHVPHFEKMLYDNAQLLSIYTHAAVVTRRQRFRQVAEAIGDWMLREMQRSDGGFSSSQDADSDGGEGVFFVWSWDELVEAVGEPVADAFGAAPNGNWDGTNVLWLPRSLEAVASERGLDPDDLAASVERARGLLFDRREARSRPATDDKVVAAWNGLAIGALAVAGSGLDEPRFLEAAIRCARFLWERMRDPTGRLLRSWREGVARVPAFADDHALVGLGFLSLYERTGETDLLLSARRLGDALLELFLAPDGGFYQVGSDAEPLVVRKVDLFDEPTPSGTTAGAELLVRLGRYTGEGRFEEGATRALARLVPIMERAPSSAGTGLRALELEFGPTAEVAIVGERTDERTTALLDAVVGGKRYFPSAIVGVASASDTQASDIPLFADRLGVGEPTAYVCRRFACRLPVTTAEELLGQLDELQGSGLT